MQTPVLVTVLASVAIIAVAAMEIFSPGDHGIAVGHVLTIAVPTMASLLGLIRSNSNGRKADVMLAQGRQRERENGGT